MGVGSTDRGPWMTDDWRWGMAKTFLLAGGGTAGHVNPLLATAAELEDRGHRVVALGTESGLEADLVPRAGVELRTIPRAVAPRRVGAAAMFFPQHLVGAIRAAGRIVDDLHPDAIVGFGGYVSAPAYIAAHRRKIPIIVHEANARPGMANRLGARWASRVAVQFAGTGLKRAEVTGFPLKKEVAELAAFKRAGKADDIRDRARVVLGWPENAVAVLVVGGSLGATRLNEAVAEAIPAIVGHGIHVLHLTGRGKDEDAERAYGDLPAKHRRQYVIREYAFDMALSYAVVDAVVCRSGAATVAEVGALGLPALYVPLPIGNGEQSLNAAASVEAGAATCIDDDQLTAAALTLRLETMLLDDKVGRDMVIAARRIGIVNGTERLATMLEEVVR